MAIEKTHEAPDKEHHKRGLIGVTPPTLTSTQFTLSGTVANQGNSVTCLLCAGPGVTPPALLAQQTTTASSTPVGGPYPWSVTFDGSFSGLYTYAAFAPGEGGVLGIKHV